MILTNVTLQRGVRVPLRNVCPSRLAIVGDLRGALHKVLTVPY